MENIQHAEPSPVLRFAVIGIGDGSGVIPSRHSRRGNLLVNAATTVSFRNWYTAGDALRLPRQCDHWLAMTRRYAVSPLCHSEVAAATVGISW